MENLLVFAIMALNFGISWFNAWSVGRYWSESKYMGKGIRIQVITGYVLSIVGFTWVYMFLVAILMSLIGPSIQGLQGLDFQIVVEFMLNLGYIILVPVLIVFGMSATIQSWVNFWKNKNLRNGTVMAWNTYTQINNTIRFARTAPSALKKVTEIAFGKSGSKKNRKKSDGQAVILAIILLLLALAGGYFTASAILKKSDRKFEFDLRDAYIIEN